MTTSPQECPVYKKCGGCPLYELSTQQEAQKKLQPVQEWLSSHAIEYTPDVQSFPWRGFRDRCDLQYSNGTVGLYQRQSNDIAAITECLKVHPLLNEAILWITRNPLPIKRASLLLRRAPDNTIGIWIDTSNLNISILLKEKTWLAKAHETFVIELGQRHKRLKVKEDGWGLEKRPVLYPWFETYSSQNQTSLLYSTIGSFTQPSMRSNKILVQAVRDVVTRSKSQHWLEYGCGTGNFTFMLSQYVQTVHLLETHPVSRKGLQRGLQDVHTKAKVRFIENSLEEHTFEAALIDPPRSGMGTSIHALATHPTCTEIIYVSCSFESMKSDMEQLFAAGYTLTSINGIDQFPKSSHCEWVAHLEKTAL